MLAGIKSTNNYNKGKVYSMIKCMWYKAIKGVIY